MNALLLDEAPAARAERGSLPTPWLLFLGDVADPIGAKTSTAIAHWRPERCVGQLRLPGCRADAGIEDLSAIEAVRRGARTMIVGTVNVGGTLPAHWHGAIVAALDAGLDVASGLHARLADIAPIRDAAVRSNRQLYDVRYETGTVEAGSGRRRSGKRLLTVGTDCSVGKMYTALSIERELRARGIEADFRATGQTGLFIAGTGVCIDAVASDFVSGAVEALAPANDAGHWDVIEGQGSLFHPSCASVTLGLIHGAQADALVLCHEPTRTHMRGLPGQQLPDLDSCMDLVSRTAKLTNPDAEFVGLSINTSRMTPHEGAEYRARLEDRFDLPCVDPVRCGVSPLVDRLR